MTESRAAANNHLHSLAAGDGLEDSLDSCDGAAIIWSSVIGNDCPIRVIWGECLAILVREQRRSFDSLKNPSKIAAISAGNRQSVSDLARPLFRDHLHRKARPLYMSFCSQ